MREAPRSAGGSPDALPVWATCAPGCEPEAAAELAALGWRVATHEATGGVIGTADATALATALDHARTVRGIHLRLAVGRVETLDDVADLLGEARLPDWPAGASVAVRAHRHGAHPFTSPQLARAAADVLLAARARATGSRPTVDLLDPDVEIVVSLDGRELTAGVALHGAPLGRRAWRRRSHRAGLDATVAAALLRRTGWRPGEVLLDPCCGAGTFLVEAGLIEAGRGPGRTAPDRLALLGLARPASTVISDESSPPATDGRPVGRHASLHGRDRRGSALDDAATNLAASGLEERVDLRRGDLRHRLDAPRVDVVVANPPFGVRMGHPGDVAELTRRGLAHLAERLTPTGRVLWLCTDPAPVTPAATAAGLEVTRADALRLGDLEATALLVRRGPDGPIAP